ncbi:MAG: hypothetical protein USCGTAYLOR_02029 [Chromatiales bacterium USCg_Taylor]|nr:MAG: hypothetical protein USCGTAYLOR_02029 [Chromatiales bacterium USCg_Taylor]
MEPLLNEPGESLAAEKAIRRGTDQDNDHMENGNEKTHGCRHEEPGATRGFHELYQDIECRSAHGNTFTLSIALQGLNLFLAIRTLPCRVARREPLCEDVMEVWLPLPKAERL